MSWPEGYPFVCAVPRAALTTDQLHLYHGDEGKVLYRGPRDPHWLYVTKKTNDGQAFGWVPKAALTIGSVKYGNMTLKTDLHIKVKTMLPSAFESRHPFARLLENLFAGMTTADALNSLPRWLEHSVGDRRTLVGDIVRGVEDSSAPSRTLMGLFSRPDFTVQELCIAGKSITNREDNRDGGVYCRVYLVENKYYIYIGSTQCFGERWQAWKESIDLADYRSQKNHKILARKAGRSYWMFSLCTLKKKVNEAVDERMRLLIEQIFVLALQTYGQYILNGYINLLQEDGADSTELSTQRIVGRTYLQADAARVLTEVYEKAVVGTGWAGGRTRANFKVHDGLNVSSPLGESSYQKTVWVHTKIPGVSESYRRPFYTVRQAHTSNVIWVKKRYSKANPTMGPRTDNPKIKSQAQSQFKLTLPYDADGPQPGEQCSMIVEFTLNGHPHPHQYARLPALGQWSDWDEVRSMGIRGEWRASDGSFKSRYFQMTVRDMIDKNIPGSLRAYANGISLVRFFKGQRINNLPEWVPNLGVARVRELSFDNLTQTITVKERHLPYPNEVPMATAKTPAQWRAALDAAGFDRIGGAFGIPIGTPQQSTGRDDCDLHYLLSRSGMFSVNLAGRVGDCSPVGNTASCEPNLRFGDRPCTWTASATLSASTATISRFLGQLWFVPESGQAAQWIEDPQVQPMMGVEDEAYDE